MLFFFFFTLSVKFQIKSLQINEADFYNITHVVFFAIEQGCKSINDIIMEKFDIKEKYTI